MSRTIDIDTKTFVRFWLVLIAFAAAGFFIIKAAGGLIIVGISAFLAISLHPLAKQIDKIDKRKSRPGLSSALAVFTIALAFAIIVGVIGPVIVEQVSNFLATAPAKISEVIDHLDINGIGNYFGIPNLQDSLTSGIKSFSSTMLGNISNIAVGSIGAISNIITSVILTIVLTILFMLDGPTMLKDFWRVMAVKDKKSAKVWQHVTSRMSNVVAAYVSSQVFIALLDGLMTMLGVFVITLIFNLPVTLAVPLGLISFLFFLIPMFGPVIGCILNTTLLFINAPGAAIAFFIFYLIYQQIENNIIGPRIQGKGLNLPPLAILVSITIGMYAFGLIGCIVAIPIAGCIKILFEEAANIRAALDDEK